MSLPEYRNLTRDELEFADQCAETGNAAGLRHYQEISARREGKSAKNTEAYAHPIRTVPRD